MQITDRKTPLCELVSPRKDYFTLLRELEYDTKYDGIPIQLETIEKERFYYTMQIQHMPIKSSIIDYKSKSMSEILKEIRHLKELFPRPKSR